MSLIHTKRAVFVSKPLHDSSQVQKDLRASKRAWWGFARLSLSQVCSCLLDTFWRDFSLAVMCSPETIKVAKLPSHAVLLKKFGTSFKTGARPAVKTVGPLLQSLPLRQRKDSFVSLLSVSSCFVFLVHICLGTHDIQPTWRHRSAVGAVRFMTTIRFLVDWFSLMSFGGGEISTTRGWQGVHFNLAPPLKLSRERKELWLLLSEKSLTLAIS